MSSFSLALDQPLLLKESDFIGKGNERACYTNPLNEKLCVKVQKRSHRSQNKIEKYYYTKLKKRKNLSPFISKYYGEVSTNMGEGLVFEKVTDLDGSSSQSIYALLKSKIISEAEAREILRTVFKDLYKNAILLGDVTKDQILLQKTENGYIPKIIDGLGTRRYGLKLFLVSNFKSFARFKLVKRWKTLEHALGI
ncbi:YrbL family protein [Marinomonas pollencensis]|uniref:PhoP regulatory network protein YrbL n=1 Tax=Marinomonas pollencensis TaxID=491954 RepID=A0A3E0DTW5_9GAMM|nr:YrbL family protein [Marinomonas pollencensis]REG87009.1 PhoP regulatory network protein YrbL [Marinomonas pollencensis]